MTATAVSRNRLATRPARAGRSHRGFTLVEMAISVMILGLLTVGVVGLLTRQIEQRRGRQFDPHVVAALATVLERHEWSVTTYDEEALERMRGYVDHDDPIAWERVSAGWTGLGSSTESASAASLAPRRARPAEALSRVPDDGTVVGPVGAP